jgi:hypothetical protein
MNGVDQIIDLWPSVADIGRDLDLPYSTVAAWKQRGSIPVAHWRDLLRAARRRGLVGVTSDSLIAAHDQATDKQSPGGFAEDDPRTAYGSDAILSAGEPVGQFSRWKRLRRSHFATIEETVGHIRALRSEWDRR